MKYILICFLSLIAVTPAPAQSESKCFRADALQGMRSIVFGIDGTTLNGVFSVESEIGAASYDFTGTRIGDTLRVRFANNQLPNLTPSEMKNLDWKLVTEDGSEILQIKLYGKNYQTNKYANYISEFESCEPSYTKLATAAKRLNIDEKSRGVIIENLNFESTDDRKSFWLKLRKDQSLEIEAPGVSISLYLPDKLQDAEGGIDILSRTALPQAGDYLVVLSPAGELGDRTAKFTIAH